MPLSRRRRGLRSVASIFLLLVLAGAARATAAPSEDRVRWTWHVTVAPDLATLRVRWEVEGFVPRRAWLADATPSDPLTLLAAPSDVAGGASLERADGEPVALEVRGASGDRACFDYVVDVAKASAGGAGRRVGGALVLRTGAYLLRAGLVPDGLEAELVVEAPPEVRVAFPGAPLGPRRWRVPASQWPFQGWTVLGAFDEDRFRCAGCDVSLVRLPGPLAASPAGLRRWVSTAIETDATLFHGRFPRERLLVTVEPSPRATEDVPFGTAWNGGGPHAFLWLSSRARDDALPGEWVGVHELLHTALPHIALDDAWFGEGFVTYYQEVLRARSGTNAPAQAWALLLEGFRRGAASTSTATLAADSAAMAARHEYRRVYWAGAAIALRLDVALRRRSGNRVSLDDVMRAVVAHPAAERRSLTGDDLRGLLASRLPDGQGARIVAEVLDARRFPDLAETWRFLGVEPEADGVTLRDDAPGVAVRDAIMARVDPVVPDAGAASGER